MTGLRKQQKIATLITLYKEKEIPYNENEVKELSTSQLAKEIIKVRGYKHESGSRL